MQVALDFAGAPAAPHGPGGAPAGSTLPPAGAPPAKCAQASVAAVNGTCPSRGTWGGASRDSYATPGSVNRLCHMIKSVERTLVLALPAVACRSVHPPPARRGVARPPPRERTPAHASVHERTGRENERALRPALVGSARALSEPADDRDGQHRPHGRGSLHDPGPRPVQHGPAVGDRRLHHPLRRPDAAVRRDRRQVQPTRRARSRARPVRRRSGLGFTRRQRGRGHRGPCGDGCRCGAHHARHALPARRDLPARRADQGDHLVGGHRRFRHRRRTADRGHAAGELQLAVHLPDQRSRDRPRHRRRLRPGTAVQGHARAADRLRRRTAVGGVDRRAGLHAHRGPARLGRRGAHGHGRHGRGARGVRPLGAAPPAPPPRPAPLREPRVHGCQHRRRTVPPRGLRRLLLPHPAPPVRPATTTRWRPAYACCRSPARSSPAPR